MSRGGRGRGRGNVTFNMESIGFGKGDALPPPTLQPPPLFPALRQPALPLLTGDDVNYMLALKKEFLQTMRNSPYYIQAEDTKNDVARYSDKYRAIRNTDNTIAWEPDWKRLPKELQIAVRKKRKTTSAGVPNLSKAKKRLKPAEDTDIKVKLEVLEKQDASAETNKSDEDEDSEAEEEVIVEDEEDNEEENDYLTSYFDNGESYLDEEEDNLDDKEGGIY